MNFHPTRFQRSHKRSFKSRQRSTQAAYIQTVIIFEWHGRCFESKRKQISRNLAASSIQKGPNDIETTILLWNANALSENQVSVALKSERL